MQPHAHTDRGISHHQHFHLRVVQLFFFAVLLTAQPVYIGCLKVAGGIQCSGFVLTDRLIVLNACLSGFFVKSNVFTIHTYCEETTGEV